MEIRDDPWKALDVTENKPGILHPGGVKLQDDGRRLDI
jgi:hypothetical protein